MTSLAAVISPTGVSAPDYPTILASLQDSFRGIYGNDIDLDADSQDGQMIAIFARAIYDCNQAVIAVYNSYAPNSAQGVGLSNLVKINGIARKVPSNSQAVVTITGRVGTDIINGQVGDNLNLNTVWALPALVNIPQSGTVDVTATCTELGSTDAAIGTLTRILTPTNGWQSVTNINVATAGNPVETDSQLRQRQTVSASLPTQTNLQGIYAAVDALDGVTRLQVYNNDTDSTNSDGIPAHSIAAVVLGGDATEIATAIANKKAPGTGTFGSTSVVVIDPHGVSDTINFQPLLVVQIDVGIAVKALVGYNSTTNALIAGSVAQFLNLLDIGEDSYYLRLVGPANLEGDAATLSSGFTQADLDTISKTFTITGITQARHGNSKSAQDLVMAFDEATACIITNIIVTVS